MIELTTQPQPQATKELSPHERQLLRKARHKRIRQVKAILRYLPRRASLHRYPVIKWFHKSALKRPYLWSFKSEYVANALFWGCITAFLPIVGVQIMFAAVVAMFVRANLPVIVALQWISNPGTLLPIYFAGYKIGDTLFQLIGARPESTPSDEAMSKQIELASSSLSSLMEFMSDAPLQNMLYLSGATFLGGAVMGIAIGTIASALYRAGFRFGIKKIPRSGLTIPPVRRKKS